MQNLEIIIRHMLVILKKDNIYYKYSLLNINKIRWGYEVEISKKNCISFKIFKII